MVSVYKFVLQASETALNLVMGAALGAFLGISLSTESAEVSLSSLAVFLLLTYFFVKSILFLQHAGREKNWKPFFGSAICSAGLIYLSYLAAGDLLVRADVFAVIAALWLFAIVADTVQALLFEKYAPRKKV